MIVPTDILTKLAVVTGSAGNTTAQGNPNASFGKYISTTAWAGAVLHDLFDKVTGDENAASTVEYRCVFIHNAHATITLEQAIIWLTSPVANGADIAIGVDPAAASAIGASPAQAAQIASEVAAPAGVSFSAPATKGAGINIGDIAPGFCRAVWIRRTALAIGPVNADGATLNIEGDTAA